MSCQREYVSPILELGNRSLALPTRDEVLAVDAREQFFRVFLPDDTAGNTYPPRVVLPRLGVGEEMRVLHAATVSTYAAVERPAARDAGFDLRVASAPFGEVSVAGFGALGSCGGVGKEDFGDEFDAWVVVGGDLGEDVEEDLWWHVVEGCVWCWGHRSRPCESRLVTVSHDRWSHLRLESVLENRKLAKDLGLGESVVLSCTWQS